MEPAKSFCSYAAMPSPRRASRASCGWETAHCSTAARRAALGVSRSARTSGARPEGGGADIAVNASRLSAAFLKYRIVLQEDRSLTVAARIGAARVNKRSGDTRANFRAHVLNQRTGIVVAKQFR